MIETLTDPELQRRVRVVLLQLSMHSNGKASTPPSLAPPPRRKNRVVCPSCRGVGSDRCSRCRGRGQVVGDDKHRSVQAHHESSIPAGVEITKSGGVPSKERSLYDHYLVLFARAIKSKDEERVRLLCFLAERDHVKAIGRPDQDPAARLAAQRRVSTENGDYDDKAAMQQVVDLYEGYPLTLAAVLEDCSPGFIEKARKFHRRDKDTGRPQRGWDGWDDEERVARIRDLRAKGWTQPKVEGELEISRSTVKRYWGHAEPR